MSLALFVHLLQVDSYLALRILGALAVVSLVVFRRKRRVGRDKPAVIANLSSGIYHWANCQYGRSTGKANRCEYPDAVSAECNGFRPCLECVGPHAVTRKYFADSGVWLLTESDGEHANVTTPELIGRYDPESFRAALPYTLGGRCE